MSIEISCPNCYKKIDYDVESLLWNDGDEQEKVCKYCDKKFKIITFASVDFDTEIIMEDVYCKSCSKKYEYQALEDSVHPFSSEALGQD